MFEYDDHTRAIEFVHKKKTNNRSDAMRCDFL